MRWKRKLLGEVFEIARGGSPRPIDNYITTSSAGYNWIMIGDAREGSKYITDIKKKISPEGLSKTRQVKPGDFLLTNSMSFGRPYILKISGCIHDGWLVLSPRSDDVLSDYFYYLLGSEMLKRQFSRGASGAVVKNLNTKMVKDVVVSVPPLAEQKRIAGILDAADALRAKRREAIAQLDTLLQSTFLDIFGDPVTNPMGWTVTSLGNHTRKVGSGATPKGGNEFYKDHGIALIRSLNVRDGEFQWKGLARIDDHQAMKLSNVVVEEEDVLLNITGASIARVCRVSRTVLPARVNQHVCIIRTTEDIEPKFLEKLLLVGSMKHKLIGIGESGATRQAITKSHILTLQIPLPPLELQRRFAAIVESVERQKARMRAHLAELDALFASLQSRAFNGEL
ncbi:MAG: restriction endonuclease subunit S [Prosthecochloris sp.]|nr:restriction endonuclease subunit S [Prosthecochloris sp.]